MGVMSVKRGTSTPAHSNNGIRAEGNGVAAGDAAEFKKAFGEQDMGQVLNKVADPNWVDPTKKARGTGNSELGKDAFMKMMLAQMKNQDPTNPTPSHEMAAQLAQFSSLEKLSDVNTSIESLKQTMAPQGNYQALAFIGKKVSGDGAKMTRVKGDTTHQFSFDLMGDAAGAKITVKDAGGNTIRTFNAANLKKGPNAIEWNGLQEDGTPARAGEYHFQIEAKNSVGQKIYAKTAFEGRITGMNFAAEGPILMVGKKQVRMSEVQKIEEAPTEDIGATAQPMPLKAGALNAQPGAMQDALAKAALGAGAGGTVSGMTMGAGAVSAGKPEVKTEAKRNVAKSTAEPSKAEAAPAEIPPAEDVDPSTFGNIADIPMAQGMMNKLAKEMK